MTPTRETFGNIPQSSQWAFYALAVISVAVLAWGCWRRYRLWNRGQPTGLGDLIKGGWQAMIARLRPGLRRLAVEGLGQQRVRGRGFASWAHGLLFAGFMALFLGTTLLEIDHLAGMVSRNWHFHHGTYYVVYEFTLDVLGLAFVLGCLFFLVRRLHRPASLGHTTLDIWVLVAFLAIGVTGYGVEGLRIGWQRPVGLGAQCSPVGLWLSGFVDGWQEASVRSAHLILWWIHAVLVFVFIAAIPFTRLFHFLAGPANLFLAPPSLGQLPLITLEQVEKEERVGVREISHFTRQQLLSLDACMECGRCEEACPAHATNKPLSPKRVVQDLKGVMQGPGNGNVHEVIGPETLWSCTACNACTAVCPVRVDPLRLILEMRRHLVAEGGLSGTAAVALRRMQSSGNPWGLPATDRSGWIKP